MARQWTGADIVQTAGAYWSSCVLQAAVQLDVFTALEKGPVEEAALARRLGCDSRAFSMLVTAMAAMGLAERLPAGVAAPDALLRFLSRNSPEYLGHIIKHQANIMPHWARLAEAVRTGRPTAEQSTLFTEDAREREDFLMGMYNIARLQAERIAEALDLSGRERLIDVGGGPGTYAVDFCRKNPGLTGTVFDLPTSEPFARKIIRQFNLEDRVGFVGGNYLTDALPKGQDVAWLSQVLHGETPKDAALLVKNAAACLRPGGLLGVQEFMLDDSRDGPERPALFNLNMLVQTAGGQAYTQGEIRAMLTAAGAARVRPLDLDLPGGARVLIGEFA